ncbi:aspartate aminotransferase family protein [Limnobacter sp.]|uniref:aspartate aminotransferase family protein n=1 Tax=Limnobacter sp. TaxID=2003368 RepID=UPI003515CA8F
MSMHVFEQRESDVRGYSRTYPVVFDKAYNARQTTEDGREFIDFFAGAGVLNFGHNNARIQQAVVEYIQSNGVTHSLDMATVAKRQFIEAFDRVVLKPRNMVHKLQFMGPTGTNAVEAALKIARRATGRQQVVAFSHGFHGMTLGSLACTANAYFRGASGVPLQHVTHQAFGCETPCRGCTLGCGQPSLDRMRALYTDTSSGVAPPAAFMVEVIQAEGGVKVASAQWLRDLQSLAKEVGALLIIDDIQAGCGRTGNYFSFDGMGLDPDIVCLAKGIGGWGTPMAMNLVKPEIDRHWAPGEHTGTFRGQNLSFVAGREALSYFEDDTLMNEVKRKGEWIKNALDALAKRHPILEVTGKGMIWGVNVGSTDVSKAVVKQCFDDGLLIAGCGTGGRVIKLIPPLTIPDEDLQQGMDILQKAIARALEAA